MARIAPSLLAADFTHLHDEVRKISASTDILHLDVMDGHFVPNISFGPAIIKQLRPHTSVYFDVHLMISNPLRYAPIFVDAGAQGITVHVETFSSVENGMKVIQALKDLHVDVGITLKPGTPIATLYPYLSSVQRALVMTVEPGFGGQSFMTSQVSKIRDLFAFREQHHLNFDIEVDGGVTRETAPLCIEAGADTLVAGTSVFKSKDYQLAIQEMGGLR